MASECGLRVMVNIVTKELHSTVESKFIDGLQQEQIARSIVAHNITETGAFGSTEFNMPHIDVEATAIVEEAAISRRFIPATMVKINKAELPIVEKPVSNFSKDVALGELLFDQTTVFSFEADDARIEHL